MVEVVLVVAVVLVEVVVLVGVVVAVVVCCRYFQFRFSPPRSLELQRKKKQTCVAFVPNVRFPSPYMNLLVHSMKIQLWVANKV